MTAELRNSPRPSRRRFLTQTMAGGAALAAGRSLLAREPGSPALIAITLDLEMSRNFPTREQTHWDYEKGNLNADAKAYTVEAARRAKARGGRIHCFALGQTMEQEDVGWLEELIREGHPIGNHTYDHVNVTATQPVDVQYRFKRAPWLMGGKPAPDVIADNVRLAEQAITHRLGIRPNGFRTPGGFGNGLRDRPDLQKMLLDQNYHWCSSLYPAHPSGKLKEYPGTDVLDAIVAAQVQAQPFVYPSGLVEIPMSPISDIGAFRGPQWPLEGFVEAIRRGVQWAIDHGAVFDFLAHPSCLGVVDPEFRTIEMICDVVNAAGPAARLTDLGEIATATAARHAATKK